MHDLTGVRFVDGTLVDGTLVDGTLADGTLVGGTLVVDIVVPIEHRRVIFCTMASKMFLVDV